MGEEPATEEELKAMLVPCASERMKIWPVGKRVRNVKNNDPDLVELMVEPLPSDRLL